MDTQTTFASAARSVCPRQPIFPVSAGVGAIGTTVPAPVSPQPIPGSVTASLVALGTSGWDRCPLGLFTLSQQPGILWKPGSPSSWAIVSEDTFPRKLLALGVCRGSAGRGSGLSSHTTIHLSLYKIIPVLGLPWSLTPFCSFISVCWWLQSSQLPGNFL